MTYALESHIVGEMKGVTFSSSSFVTTSKISEILDEADAEINGYINARYNLPITDSSALLFLRKIAIDIVVYRVSKILEIKSSKPIPDGRIIQDISSASTYRQAIKVLEGIRDGKNQLYGATLKSSVGNVKSYNNTNNIEPQFKVDEQQW